jgi:exodeoxyribonuclease VII large subunit
MRHCPQSADFFRGRGEREDLLSLVQGNTRVYTVSELTEEIRGLLEEHFPFVWIEGEISNFRSPISGHYYMVLKDENAQIRGVMFRQKARSLKFVPEDGMKVVAQGRVGIYAARGEYQVILDYLEPMGVGALALAFDQVKRKLASQGVFDAAVKKPLPFLPQRVAVITSPTGAAIRDFLKILGRRFANMEVVVVPVRVQGEEASGEIIHALEMVNRRLPVDVIILTRGGGSLEDLWAFNQEALALAIRRSHIPVISAVGHEIDVTISDLAADFRAPTPSAAAEMLVAEKEILLQRVIDMRRRLKNRVTEFLKKCGEYLESTAGRLRDPRKRLADSWMHLDDLYGKIIRAGESFVREGRRALDAEKRALYYHSPLRLVAAMQQERDFSSQALIRAAGAYLKGKNMALAMLGKQLTDLSPLSILSRGYSITLTVPESVVVRKASSVGCGDLVQVLLGEGGLACRVEKTSDEGETALTMKE